MKIYKLNDKLPKDIADTSDEPEDDNDKRDDSEDEDDDGIA